MTKTYKKKLPYDIGVPILGRLTKEEREEQLWKNQPRSETRSKIGPRLPRNILTDYFDMIENLIDLVKGRYTEDWEKTYYNMFLDRIFNMPVDLVYKTTEEVINELKGAYWLDEEDLRQDIYVCMIHLQKFRGAPYRIRGGVSRDLRDELVNRQRFWKRSFIEKKINEVMEVVIPNGFFIINNKWKTPLYYKRPKIKKHIELNIKQKLMED
jgi:hypothetical protein